MTFGSYFGVYRHLHVIWSTLKPGALSSIYPNCISQCAQHETSDIDQAGVVYVRGSEHKS
jgi:hypothetical protein